jgi:hypothetical protein
MRRRFAAMAAAFGVMLTLFVVAEPNAFAGRVIGPYSNTCYSAGDWSLTLKEEVVWHSGTNYRDVWWDGYVITGAQTVDGYEQPSVWAKAVGGDWVRKWWDSTDTLYQANAWYNLSGILPSLNPGQGHYWKVRAWYNNPTLGNGLNAYCESPVILN